MRYGARGAALVCALALLGGCAAPPAREPAPVPGAGQPGATGVLRISSSPAGARIIIDEEPTNFRTPTAFPLPEGSHRVMLSLAAHRNWAGDARVEAGATTQVDATLVALGSGSIVVASSPAGAAVFVDGEPTDLATPATIPAVPVGTHTVQLRHDGFEPWSQAVFVRQDRQSALQATLSPLRRACGQINVRSHPPQALVAIDGVPSWKVTPLRLTDVAAGTHTLDLTLAGYQPWSGPVVVDEGKCRDVLVTMRRLPVQEAGHARIETDPPGAAIRLNGVDLDRKSPASLDGLPPGTFLVELALPGAKTWRGELTVVSGRRTLLQISLGPAADR